MNNGKKSVVPPSFWNVDFGEDEARGDENLEHYFVPIPEYDRIVSGDIRYVIGRKGTGKTTILEKLRIEAQKKYNWCYSALSLRNFPLPYVRDLRDRSMRDKSQYVPVWRFLILVEVCNMVMADESARPYSVKAEINAFIKENFPGQISFVDSVTHLRNNSQRVNVLEKWLGVGIASEQETTTFASMHYEKASDILVNKLLQMESDSVFFVFMDELDEGFRAGDANLRLLLLALLRAVYEVHLDFKKSSLKVRPVLALRSDIFDRLEDNDLNKLDDSTLRISWVHGAAAGCSLVDIVNARIRASFPDIGSNPWASLVYDSDPTLPGSVGSVWKYMVNRTFERPRDLIKYLKYCQRTQIRNVLDYNAVSEAEIKFSQWFHDEFRDEVHSYLPVWREVLQCISRIGVGVIECDQLRQALQDDPKVATWMRSHSKSVDSIIEILFDFSVVGNLDETRRWLFNYKDPGITWTPSMRLIVHYGFHKKLRIRSRS